jgi:glycine/D-amino acid oxidase-like deaminating enzyme
MQGKRVAIIGGGFFGLYLAEDMAKKGAVVDVFEKGESCMQRASYVNQARVHNGYHYPRSVLTALRSRVSFPRFCEEFPECVVDDFEKYYMVGSILGKVTANQFERFCERIGASCEPAPKQITKLVNPRLIEAVFKTREFAFDSVKLRDRMLERIEQAGVRLHLSTTVCSVAKIEAGLRVKIQDAAGAEETLEVHDVFNCTYAMLNGVQTEPPIAPIPLKHELTEMCLVEVPDVLKKAAITVMCGPFFSVMPFPPKGLHSFSHVRYTPHAEWHESSAADLARGAPYSIFDQSEKKTAWSHIRRDAERYMPILGECRYDHSIWEVKTVLPKSEKDDSRPILFKPNYGIDGYHCVMGGKIDNVYDAVSVIEQKGLDR